MKKITIGSFEIKFCNYLHANKVATTKQLHRDLFAGASYQFCCKQLQFFVEKKVISKLYGAEDFERSFVYTLAENGMKIFTANNKSKVAYKRFKSNSVTHDVMLTEIRSIMLQKKMVKNYYTENQIQTYRDFDTENDLVIFKKNYCDALVSLHSPGKPVINTALEFESSDKSLSDYREKISDLYRHPEIVAIFYICRDKIIEDRIKKAEKDLYPDQYKKIHFLQLDQFLKSNKSVTFSNQDDKQIVIH